MPKLYLRFFILLLTGLCPFISKGAVTAAFTVDNVSGCTPLVVHFTNTSTDAVSYSWNLGNSTTSAVTDPSASYLTAGTYTVTLTAYNGAASSTHSMVITVYPLPIVNFNANDTTVCLGVPVTYTNTSVPGTAGIVSYTWNFGDGSTSTIASPVYTHSSPGFYNITLFATNSMGCSRSLSKSSYVEVYTPPVVSFSGSGTFICRPPSSVPFSNTSSGTLPLSYNWSFGDGSAASIATNPSHSYTTPGSYNVRLRVTDGHACIDSMVYPGYVTVSGLDATFSSVASVCQGIDVTFANTSTPHLFSSWDFGDGITSADESPTHSYLTPGIRNVRLVVYDGSCYDTVIHPITVFANPVTSFTITPANPCPTPVTINYTATLEPGCTASWVLHGPAATGSGASVNHLYNVGLGSIDTVILTVTNGNGCVTVLQQMDTIYNLSVVLKALPQFGCIPLTTSFLTDISANSFNTITAQYIDLVVPYTVSGYNWNFGDGSPPTTMPSPGHTYTGVGAYTVACTITTTSGCNKTSTMLVGAGLPPVVTFTATPTQVCAGKTIHFSTGGSSTVNSYLWEYGDGAFDSGAAYSAPSYLYVNPGIDTVRLTGYHNGCPSPQVKHPVIVDPPNALPVITNLCIPNNGIAFGDSSIGVDTRLWEFGDGDTSTAKCPTHYYSSLSDFNVRLTTYNATSGCRDTVYEGAYLSPPFLYVFAADNTICKDESAVFYPFASGTPSPGFGVLRSIWYIDTSLVNDELGYVTPTAPFPIHTPGYHDVTYIIQDTRGCFDTLVRNNFLLVGNPTDSFTVSPPIGCGPLAVNFTNHSTGIPECPLFSYSWLVGDGTPDFLSAGADTSYVYPAAGSYGVSLTVMDSIGCLATTDIAIPVQVYRPHAGFYADVNNVCFGTNVHFNNTSTDFVSSFWIFGDGGTSTTASPYHMYASSGAYTVKLVATDSHGCSDTATLLNYIYIASSPVSSFTMSDSFAVCPPLNVNFTNSSIGAATYSWSFGNSASSVAVSPSNPYTAPGYYTVRLVARNTTGCTDTAIRHVNVFGYNGAFTYTPLSGCMPLPVHFSAALGSVASLVWDFGDGYTSSVSLSDTISHTYLAQGTYVPKLILTDSTGCSNVSIGTDTIKADILTPNFRINPNPVCEGSSVVFTDSSYAIFSAPSSWAWSFGSGATGTGNAPIHAFTVAGVHTVTLVATNSLGCSASITKTVTVNAIPAAISGGLAVCAGYTTTLSNASSGGSWSSSAPAVATVSSTGLVTGVTLGTSRITYTLSAGCIATAVVTVYSVPAAITGANVVCEGSTTVFSTTTTGGSWSSSAPLIGSVHAASGTVTGVAAGTATISYSLGTGCFVVKDISVNPTPAPITGVTGVCVNSTTTLFESATGGVWSSGNLAVGTIDASGMVTGIAAGTTGITYAFGTGCRVVTVATIHPLPDTISGNLAVCDGQTTILSNTATGGTWSSSNTAVAVIHPVLGTVLGMSVGTAGITYTLPTGCRVSKVVSVNAVPTPIFGTTVVCVDGTTTLIEIATGGVWSSGNPLVATVDAAGVVTGVAAGTVSITYSFASTCFVTTIVTVQPLPNIILGNPQLCIGFTTTLVNTTGGGTWSSTDPTVASVSGGGVVTALNIGTSIISYTLPTGCARSVVATVNPLPTPIVGVLDVCVGVPTNLSTTPTGGWWASDNTSIAVVDMFSGDYTGVSPGTTRITYTSAAGCIITTLVTIEAVPPPITGGFTVCAGFALNLTNAMPGGVWSTNPGTALIGTIHPITGVISGITPGTVTVSYTVMTGCMVDLIVTVVPLPPLITGIPNLCVGNTTVLSDASIGGLWTSSMPARASVDIMSGVVTGHLAGTVVITYTIGSGCFNILPVTVNPVPAPITGSSSVCVGSTITLASTTPLGIWVSDHTDTATIGFTGGVLTGIGAGTATISYTLSTGCNATKQVTVLPVPPAITGNAHVCIGSSATLANAMPSGSWTSSDPSVATVGMFTGVVSSVSLGTSVISYIIPTTGCAAVRIVTVEPLPTVYNVSGDSSYCEGGVGVPIMISGSQIGVSYVLYYGTSATGYLGGTGFVLNFGLLTAPGVYTVQATNVASGCMQHMSGSATVSTIPLVTPLVSISPSPNDTTCPGNTVVFTPVTAYSGTLPTYLWKVNGTLVSAAPSYSFIPANGDLVSVIMTSNDNCLATTIAVGNLTMTVLPSLLSSVNVLVSPGDTICEFATATYTAVPTLGGYSPTYRWLVNGSFVGSGSVYSYIPQQGDVVYCAMASNYLCRIDDTVESANVVMAVDSLLLPHVSVYPEPGYFVEAGKPVTLYTAVTDAGPNPKYQWKVNGYPVAGATDANYTAIFNDYDSISCVVTSSGVCANVGTHDWVFITTTPLNSTPITGAGTSIVLLPNPNRGTFAIRGTLGNAINEEVVIEVTNVMGQVVYKGGVTAKKGIIDEQVTLNNELANGMYMLNMTWGSEHKVFHFVIRQ